MPHSTPSREDWLQQQLHAQNQALSDVIRQAKYEAMASAPFVFFRGTNHLYWADFADYTERSILGDTLPTIWTQGDLHPENIGSFHDPQGTLIYALNDFDDAVLTDAQLDLWRCAIGIALVAHAHNQEQEARAFPKDVQASLIVSFGEAYLDTLARYATQETLPAFTSDDASGRVAKFLEKVTRKKSRARLLEKWTKIVDGQRILKEADDDTGEKQYIAVDESIVKHIVEAFKQGLQGTIATQSPLIVKSVRQRLYSGTGSLGITRYDVLVQGPDPTHNADMLFDVKHQMESAPWPYLSEASRAQHQAHAENHAARVVAASHAMAPTVDPHVGWISLPNGHFSVKERSPFKGALKLDKLRNRGRFGGVVPQWGRILALAHLRGSRALADTQSEAATFASTFLAAIQDKRGLFLAQLREIGIAHAQQTIRDHDHFRKHIHKPA